MDHRLVQAAIAGVVLGAAAGCATSVPATAAALSPGAETTYGLAPLKPGPQLGLLDVDLVNRSHLPITLDSVTGIGRGLGTVIRVVEVKIAPAHGNGSKDSPAGLTRPTHLCGGSVRAPASRKRWSLCMDFG
jgi:hypothetical protein